MKVINFNKKIMKLNLKPKMIYLTFFIFKDKIVKRS